MNVVTAPRRTQAEKSAAMRERILEATIESLVELGYARTTTTEVTARAGVSRGAMLHHFPAKTDLVAAAVEFVMERLIAEFTASVKRLGASPDIVADVFELLWRNFISPTSYAVLELTVAARTDPELYERLQPLYLNYEAIIARKARELFGGFAASPRDFENARRFIYHVLYGLAVARILREDDAEARAMLDVLKRQAVNEARALLAGRKKSRSSVKEVLS